MVGRLCAAVMFLVLLPGCSNKVYVIRDAAPDDGSHPDEALDVGEDDGLEEAPGDAAEDVELAGEDAADVDEGEGGPDFEYFIPECEMLDYPPEEIGVVEPVPCDHAMEPMPCGENCRQVSFVEPHIWKYHEWDVWGDWLVVNTNSYPETPRRKKIVIIDLTSLNQWIINETNTIDPGKPVNCFPAIFENRVYYSVAEIVGSSYQNERLYEYEINTHVLNVIRIRDYPCVPEAGQWASIGQTRAFGNHLVFEEDRTETIGGEHIHILDLETREECRISPGFPCPSGCTGGPSIHGGRVVFSGGVSGGGGYVFMYDIGERRTTVIRGGEGDCGAAIVWNDVVTWVDTRNGGTLLSLRNADIYMIDLFTMTERPVCTHPASQFGNALWGETVVWSDCRNDPVHPDLPSYCTESDLYALDLGTGEERRVTSLPGGEGAPVLRGNKVYFMKLVERDNYQIFELTLEE